VDSADCTSPASASSSAVTFSRALIKSLRIVAGRSGSISEKKSLTRSSVARVRDARDGLAEAVEVAAELPS
jgi:hypothetical protein